jgi:hypothetical protein
MPPMKTNQRRLIISLTLLVLALSLPASAQLTNNFTTPYNYVANGIVGDTNWDGIYMFLGDIPNNNDAGGNGPAVTAIADSGITFPGYLSIRSQGTDWAGGDNDGFFVWKLVSGDFDVSVQSSPFTLSGGLAFDNRANNFCGLMARAYKPDNSGAPYSQTTTNYVENYVMLWRFQEFNLDEVNEAINGARSERIFTDVNTDITNATRYYRIVRSSLTNFTFYWKTNAGDAWALISQNQPTNHLLPLSQLSGPLQVGIAQGAFSTATRDAVFTDFELNATNVSFPAFPAAPSALVTTATNIGGSLTLSWTVGDPVNDRSLVIVRANGTIEASPIQGIVYSADAAYGDTNAAVAAAREFVVYNGTGNSVTVTNLAGNNTLYTVAVYEYSNPAAPVYNTASPATNTFNGPGIITGVITSISPTNLPVGGAALGKLFATFSSGSGTVDESASASWVSSDPTIATFNVSTLSAVGVGTCTVTGSFGGFVASQVINVHAPAFTDNFGTAQDYIANGLEGSAWDGLFLNFGDVPGVTAANDQDTPGVCSQCTAQTNVLFIDSAGSDWWLGAADGPYLFKIVTGDFQASVHIGTSSTINANDNGIMVRLYNNSGGALQGGGGGTGGLETHLKWAKIQNGQVACRRTIDSGGTTVVNGLNGTDRWLLMQRLNSTNFFLYEGSTGTNWLFATSLVLAEASNNAPVEVGLEHEMRSAADGFGRYDTLMIDGPGITPPTNPPPPANNLQATLNVDLSMTFSWVAADATGTNPIRSALIMRASGPVTAFPTLSQAGAIGGTGTPVNFGTGLSLGGGNWLVFATGNPAASTNVTCTVKNLSPGVTYYAAVVTFVGSGGNKSFNNVIPANGAVTNVQDGALLSVAVIPPPPIPMGGVGKPVVLATFQGGAVIDISQFVPFFPANNTIIVATNGLLTGVTNGTTQVTSIYRGFTNVFSATVRSPQYTDNFTAGHDYLANGVTGSGWNGLYNPTTGVNPVPESVYVPLALSGATVADANITTNNQLTVTAAGDGWENGASGGFFLWKYVPLDFQAVVHLKAMDIVGYNQPGLLARQYTSGTNGTDLGAPFIPATGGETWVSLCRFEEFGFGTYARLNQNSAVQQSTQSDPNDGKTFIMIYRSNGTNFNFYKRASLTAPWENIPLKTTYQVAESANQPMQVGIMAGPWDGASGTGLTTAYDNFMLDWTDAPTPTATLSGPNVIISWPPDPQLILQSTTSLIAPAVWSNEAAGTLGPNGYSESFPVSAVAQKFFRLKQ